MKISVITPVYNGAETISSCINSLSGQTYNNYEHIIVDGASFDRTLEIIRNHQHQKLKWISEKDKGLYDAFNKGINMATGDVVCFLCADDMYTHKNVLKNIASAFSINPDAEIIYTDIIYVNKKDPSKIDRYWKSSPFKQGDFKKGWLPPNTALFIKKEKLMECGLFDINFRMAADYELQYRLFEKKLAKTLYISDISVTMRSGGMSNSSPLGMFTSLKECYKGLKKNKVSSPMIYIINTLFYRFKQTIIPKSVKRYYKQLLKNK